MSNEFEQKSTWNETGNQKRILRRIGLDALSGSLAALSVAPMIFMIDKAIVQKASGTMTLRQSFKDSCISLFKHPGRFILKREFLLVMFVYGSTYTAANAIDSLCKIYNVSDIIPKMVGVTAVKIYTSIIKDRAFAYSYGKPVNNKVGPISLFLWLIRDLILMTCAFVLPSRISPMIEKSGFSESNARKLSQISLPVSFQLFLTPIHLLGYDYYNFKNRRFPERVTYISSIYFSAIGIRMLRMGIAYGIGGNNNLMFRDKFISKYEGVNWNASY